MDASPIVPIMFAHVAVSVAWTITLSEALFVTS